MIKVLLLTHGALADSLRETMQLFLPDSEQLVCLGMGPDTGAFREALHQQVVGGGETELLVLTDLFGGTPFNMIASMLKEAMDKGKKVEVITGVNLPMLLEVVPNIQDSSLQELKALAFDNGKFGIRDLLVELKSKEVK